MPGQRTISWPVSGVAFAPDQRSFLSAGVDQTVRIWDLQTGREIRHPIGHSDAVYRCIFSPDGRFIATASFDKTARLWDADYHETIRYLCGRLLRDFSDDERAQYGIPNDGPTCPRP